MLRDGKWWPSREANLIGTLGVFAPGDFADQEAPGYIDDAIRLSWAPAHLNVAFKYGRARNKISFRPDRHRSDVWVPAVRNDDISHPDNREDSPPMFNIPIDAHRRGQRV